MGRHSKYQGDPLGPQKAYLQTPRGKAAYKRYQISEKGKTKKREWARRERLKQLSSKPQKFIDKYGDLDAALNLLDDREEEVIVRIYGLDGNLPIKQKDIAEEWGTSHQWITQIKQSAIAKLEAAKQAKAEATEQDQNSSPPEAQREES